MKWRELLRKCCFLNLRDELREVKRLNDTGSFRLREATEGVQERTRMKLSPQARALLDLAGTVPRDDDDTVPGARG